jgi:hypothetical protein
MARNFSSGKGNLPGGGDPIAISRALGDGRAVSPVPASKKIALKKEINDR